MTSILELLSLIEKRPAMYLGKPSISYLKCYLNGWLHGFHDLELYHSIPDIEQYAGFQLWIEEKFYTTTSHGWDGIILFYSAGEEEALDNFFKYFNEWLAFTEKNEWRHYLTR